MDFIDEYYARRVEEYEELEKQKLSKVKNSKVSINNNNWYLNFTIPKQKFEEELACGVDVLIEPNEVNFPYSMRFLCYPNGNSKENEGYVSFMFQELSSSLKNCILNFTFSLIDEEGSQRFLQSFAKEYGKFIDGARSFKAPQYGLVRYIERKKLLSSDVFFSDMLHVKCEIHFYPKETPGDLIRKPYEMRHATSENPGTLLITNAEHDLWEFLAEKSSYFKKTLITDGATKITPFDKEDYMALNVMAKSIIQKEVPRFHHTIEAFHLYKFADRVLMPNFKLHCSNYLGENMSVDIVLEVIVMADMYNDQLLKDLAIKFALENWQEVIATSNWTLLQERRPKLAEEIYDRKLGKEKEDSLEIRRETSKIVINTSEKNEQFQFYL